MKKILITGLLVIIQLLTSCVDNTINKGHANENNQNENVTTEEQEQNKMYITINDHELEVELENNSSVMSLIEILKNHNLVYNADDYGNFEKVGSIGYTLPRNDHQIKAEAGDVILYQGNQIVLAYGNNSWTYTKLGRIEGYTTNELRDLLGAGKGIVQVTISLNNEQ